MARAVLLTMTARLLYLYFGAVIAIATAAEAESPGNMVIIPKYGQINFDQNILGAALAEEDSNAMMDGNVGPLEVLTPDRATSRKDQIDFVRNATMNSATAIMISNNAGQDIEGETLKAHKQGTTVVSFDSPLKNGAAAGEDLFISPVDFDETGLVMAEMTLNILGPEGGDFAILSTNPHAANQNSWIATMQNALSENPERYSKLNLIGIYFPTVDALHGYAMRTLELVEAKQNGTYPNLGLIMAPTTSGGAAAAKALLENGLCDEMKISGLQIPAEVLEASQSGCVPEFAFWNNVDVGYLAYYSTHALATNQIQGKEGEVIQAGRLGERTIEKDPTREDAVRVVLGKFQMYNSENVERAAFIDCIMGFCGDSEEYFEERFMIKYQKRLLSVLPKVTGMISFLCSSLLVLHILRDRERRNSTFQRIILGMSLSDMLSSFFGFFLSTWPMPEDTWLAYGAIGTEQTCSAQGFLFQLGISATPLYNCALATFYLFKIVLRWDHKRIAKMEPFLHFLPISIGFGTAIAGLFLELYNPASRGHMCWINEYPPYCSNTLSCERGEGAVKFRWAFLYGFVCLTFVWLAIVMFLVFRAVLKKERAVDKYRVSGDVSDDGSRDGTSPVCRKHSKRVANQAKFYVLAFAFPWIWGLILSIINTRETIFSSGSADDAITAFQIVNAVIFPLQGLFNALVYARPRYHRIRRKHPEMNFMQISAKVLTPGFKAEKSTSVSGLSSRRFSRRFSSKRNLKLPQSILSARKTSTSTFRYITSQYDSQQEQYQQDRLNSIEEALKDIYHSSELFDKELLKKGIDEIPPREESYHNNQFNQLCIDEQ